VFGVRAEEIAWKKPVEGIREMCDGCNTTLFNMHWTCSKCGHAVCLDCYDTLRQCKHTPDGPTCRPCKQILQRCCVRKQLHAIDQLAATQIIPSDGLFEHLFLHSGRLHGLLLGFARLLESPGFFLENSRIWKSWKITSVLERYTSLTLGDLEVS